MLSDDAHLDFSMLTTLRNITNRLYTVSLANFDLLFRMPGNLDA